MPLMVLPANDNPQVLCKMGRLVGKFQNFLSSAEPQPKQFVRRGKKLNFIDFIKLQ
jgi:hypothetical protein